MLRRVITQLAMLGALGLCAHVADSQSATADRLTYTTFQRPSNWDIYLFQGSGQSPRRLTTDPALDYDPVVSPDGRWLVFCSERRGNPDLYVLDLQASGGEPRLLIDSDALEDQASFSADSRSLTFVSTFSGSADVYLLPFQPGQTARMTDARNLTRHPAGDFRPAFSPDSRKIVFSSDREIAVRAVSPINRERSSDIYVLDLETQGLQRLTDTPGWDGSPKWSADGRQIVFYSQRGTDLDGRLRQSRIWMMASNGLNQRVVTAGESVAVSPEFLSNSRIIYSRRTAAGRWEIASVALDGSDARIESDPSSSDYRAPTKGPANGSFIVYSDGPVAADPAGGYRRSAGEATLFSGGPVLVSGAPFRKTLPDRQIEVFPLRYFAAVLHPDEDMLLHLGPPGPATGPGGAPELLVSRTDGTLQRSLTRFDETQTEPLGFSWSNDGQWIVFTRGGATVPGVAGFAATGGADVWKMRADGSELQNLTSGTPGYDGHPSFSGDGKQIVFRSERTGQSHIHVMDADGGNVRQLTDGAGRDLFPVFSPTSSQIAFASNRNSPTSGLYEIFLLELKEDGNPGTMRRLTNNTGQKGHLGFSWDGEWLVFASEEGGISDETPLAPAAQPYGELYAYRIGSGAMVRLTHNKWEEGIPSWQRGLAPLRR